MLKWKWEIYVNFLQWTCQLRFTSSLWFPYFQIILLWQKNYVNLFWILLTTSELALVDRRNKREIRHLEQELPKWQVLVDSVTGWYFFCCSESKDLFFTPFSGITQITLIWVSILRWQAPHSSSLPWQALSCQCFRSSVFLLKSILSVNVLVPFFLFKTSCLQYC